MRTRDGYVSIIAITVMSISMIIILEIGILVKMQIMILNSGINKIQSYYCAEDKVLMSIYDKKYYTDQIHPIILDVFRTHNFATKPKDIIIDQFDLDKYDTYNSVKLNFQDKDNRKQMILKTQSDYKNVNTSIQASINLVNRLFEIEEAILDINTVEDEYKNELETLLINIEENISSKNIDKAEFLYTSELCDFSNVSLNKLDNEMYNLICLRDTMEYPYNEVFSKKEVFIVIKKPKNKETNLYINCDNKLVELSGIMYIEGDLTISGKFIFNGIIIIKDGEIKIESEVNPEINGMIILSNTNISQGLSEGLDLQYNKFLVYKYGTFIPGFLDININLIRSGN